MGVGPRGESRFAIIIVRKSILLSQVLYSNNVVFDEEPRGGEEIAKLKKKRQMPRRYARGLVIGRIGLRIRNSNFSGTRDELPQR